MLLKLTTTIDYLEQQELSAAWRAKRETPFYLHISPVLEPDFCFNIKKDFISFHKHIFQEPLLNSTTNRLPPAAWKNRKRRQYDELDGLIRWWTGLIFCYCVLVLLRTMMVMLFKIENDQSVPVAAGVGCSMATLPLYLFFPDIGVDFSFKEEDFPPTIFFITNPQYVFHSFSLLYFLCVLHCMSVQNECVHHLYLC